MNPYFVFVSSLPRVCEGTRKLSNSFTMCLAREAVLVARLIKDYNAIYLARV